MHPTTRIENSLEKLSDFLENCDDKALKFFNFSSQFRDQLCSSTYDIVETTGRQSNLDAMSVWSDFLAAEDPYLQITYNSDMLSDPENTIDDNCIVKILGHEIDHVRELQSPEAAVGYRKHPLYKLLEKSIKKPLAAAFWPTMLILYDKRLQEKKADILSDKIMPELTFKDAMDQVTKPIIKGYAGNRDDHFIERINTLGNHPVMKVAHLFMPHPSQFTRITESNERCADFYEFKQQTGIPSLYDPAAANQPSRIILNSKLNMQ